MSGCVIIACQWHYYVDCQWHMWNHPAPMSEFIIITSQCQDVESSCADVRIYNHLPLSGCAIIHPLPMSGCVIIPCQWHYYVDCQWHMWNHPAPMSEFIIITSQCQDVESPCADVGMWNNSLLMSGCRIISRRCEDRSAQQMICLTNVQKAIRYRQCDPSLKLSNR